MADKKIIAVVGATGAQGGGLVRVILNDTAGGFTARKAGGHLTGAQMAASLTRALGREVRYNEVSPETFRGYGFPGADDRGNMFQFYRGFEDVRRGARGLAVSRRLNPELQTFDQWLAAHKHEIPLV